MTTTREVRAVAVHVAVVTPRAGLAGPDCVVPAAIPVVTCTIVAPESRWRLAGQSVARCARQHAVG